MFGTIDWKKIGKGALLATGGALISYGLVVVVPAIAASGTPGALVIATVASTLLNAARKALDGKVE
jgi:hypothetical protein